MSDQTTEINAERQQNGVKIDQIRSMESPNETEPLVERKSDENENGGWLVQCLSVSMLGLALIEYCQGVTDHSTLLKMEFAASVLAFLSSVEHILNRKAKNGGTETQSVYLLYRTAGIVYYIACMFLNLTHSLEEISDINTSDSKENVTQSHEHGPNKLTIGISAVDLLLKVIFHSQYNALPIHPFATSIAVVFPSIVTIVVLLYKFSGYHVFFKWFDRHVEPVVGIALTIVCIAVAVFAIVRNKHFLLAEGPKNFDVHQISESVKAKHESLQKIDHVHASCEWPKGFTVSLKAFVKVEKSRSDWVSSAADDFARVKNLLRTEILAVGATQVTIEPVFVDRNDSDVYADTICIDRSCHNVDVGCCTNPKPNDESQA